MKTWAIAAISLLLAACAAGPAHMVAAERDAIFRDSLFKPPSERISADDLFALSPEMHRYWIRKSPTPSA